MTASPTSSSSSALPLPFILLALFDKTDPWHYTAIILGSYILTLLAQIASHIACGLLLPQTYAALPPARRDEWNTRVCSTFHALAVSALSCYVMLTGGPSLYKDVRHYSYLAPVCLAITTGYLLGDATLVLYSVLPRSLQPSFLPYGPLSAPVPTLAHHFLGALAFSSSLYFRAGYILSIMFIATELSTPFVNLRWHLLYSLPPSDHTVGADKRPASTQVNGGKAGGGEGDGTNVNSDASRQKKNSFLVRLMRLTDVVMVVVFGFCRVLALPFQFRMVVRHVLPLGRVSAWWVSVQCGASFVVIGVLNVWWFGKMLALLRKGGRKGGKGEE